MEWSCLVSTVLLLLQTVEVKSQFFDLFKLPPLPQSYQTTRIINPTRKTRINTTRTVIPESHISWKNTTISFVYEGIDREIQQTSKERVRQTTRLPLLNINLYTTTQKPLRKPTKNVSSHKNSSQSTNFGITYENVSQNDDRVTRNNNKNNNNRKVHLAYDVDVTKHLNNGVYNKPKNNVAVNYDNYYETTVKSYDYNSNINNEYYTTKNPFFNSPGVKPAVFDHRPPITNRPPTKKPSYRPDVYNPDYTQHTTRKPVTNKPTNRPDVYNPDYPKQTTRKPVTDKPIYRPDVNNPDYPRQITRKPVTNKPINSPDVYNPDYPGPTTRKPVTDKPVYRPDGNNPDYPRQTTRKPVTNKPINRPDVYNADYPGPTTRKPVTNKPTVTVKPYIVNPIPTDAGALVFPHEDEPPEIIRGPDEDYMSSAEKRRYIEIAERMCDNYKSLTTKNIQAIPLLPSPEPVQVNVSQCTPTTIPLVVGGKVVSINEFPHMALLGWVKIEGGGYSWKCGGSLISDQYVLTAAHCSYQERDNTVIPGPPRVVQLGSSYLDDPGALVVRVAAVIRHPKYKLPRSYYDIALLKLVQPVTFSEVIKPACLGIPPTVDEPIIATGWGKTELGGDQSLELRSVSLPVWNINKCHDILGTSRKMPDGPSSDSQLCAGEMRGGKDTCQGDSGGPAQIQDGCVWRVVAVTSVGRSCGAANTPGLYALVHRAFISAQVFGNNRNNPSPPTTTTTTKSYYNDQPIYDQHKRGDNSYDNHQIDYNNNRPGYNNQNERDNNRRTDYDFNKQHNDHKREQNYNEQYDYSNHPRFDYNPTLSYYRSNMKHDNFYSTTKRTDYNRRDTDDSYYEDGRIWFT